MWGACSVGMVVQEGKRERCMQQWRERPKQQASRTKRPRLLPLTLPPQLVPGGRGELVMQKRAAAATGGEEEDEEGAAGGSEEALGKYSGVKVKVRGEEV